MASKQNSGSVLSYILALILPLCLIFFFKYLIKIIKLNNPFFFQSNWLLLVLFQGLFIYILVGIFNIKLLNKRELNKGTVFQQLGPCYITTIVYIFILLILVGLITQVYSLLIGLGFNLIEIIAFLGLSDVIYIFLIPPIYLKFRYKLKQIKWLN